MAKRRNNEPLPEVGRNIMRPVGIVQSENLRHTEYSKMILDVEFTPSDRGNGTLMFRAIRAKETHGEYMAIAGKPTIGLCCFIKGRVPDNWTHFEIMEVHRSGSSVIVEPRVYTEQILLDVYDSPQDLANAHEVIERTVIDILMNKPELLPAEFLAENITDRQFREIWALRLQRTSDCTAERALETIEVTMEHGDQAVKACRLVVEILKACWAKADKSKHDHFYKPMKKAEDLLSVVVAVLRKESLIV